MSRNTSCYFAVESPISVGSGRYCFKKTEDFETGRKGGSGKGTQLPLITAQQPFLFQDACSAGAAPASPAWRACAPPLFRAPTFAGNPPRPGWASAGSRPALSPTSRSAARSLARPFTPVRAVTRSPISWWILLKRPRSRSRTKAIVLLPPLDSASLPECPFLYNYFHCVCARRGVGKPCAFQCIQETELGEGEAFNKTCSEVSGAPMERFSACLPRARRRPSGA